MGLELLAACGLYCGACYHYRASLPDGAHLLTAAARGGRPLEGYACSGCRSDRLYIHPGCRDCAIRDCAESRGLEHCGECDALPCERLVAFQTDGRRHHVPIVENLKALAQQGVADWLRDQATRWQCSICGTGFSWYEETCRACGTEVRSYGADLPVPAAREDPGVGLA